MNLFRGFVKLLILGFAAITISILSFSNILAQETTGGSGEGQNEIYYLNLIEQHTKGTLELINTFPTYLQELYKMAQSWNRPDDTPDTAAMQPDFTNIGSVISKELNLAELEPRLLQITADFYGVTPKDLQGDNPKITKVMPPGFDINDLSYATLLGIKVVPKTATANSPYNYIKYVSGIQIPHELPDPSTMSNDPNYFVYWPVVMAIESFDAYVLSNKLTEPPLTAAQQSLVDKASKPDWLLNVAGKEDLGQLFRQLLTFVSQSYVLQTQQLQIERDILSGIAMNNTLLILMNRDKENLMVSKAKGEQPR